MGFIKILDVANELTLNKFKIGMKIAYSFIVVDSLMLIVTYLGLYGDSLGGFVEPKRGIMIFSFFAIISSILMCMGLARSIMKPLNEFSRAANRISEGDLTKDVDFSSKDELGNLAGYFNTMTENLRSLTGQVQAFSSKVASTAHELSASSQEIKASTDQISCNTQDIAGDAGEQSEKLTNISDTLKEMSEIIKQVSTGSQRAADVAMDSSNSAKKISGMSNEIVSKMKDIKVTVANSAEVIKKLDGNSEKIGQIVGVITDIADQTNLLALNAAIEAARAGEHGRGFAVVAEEVRKLAEESARSANQITGLIKNIQQGTQQAVISMERGTTTVSDGSKSIEITVSSINTIVDATKEAADMFNEIKEVAKAQVSSIDNVSSSVQAVSEISRDSARATHEAAAATQEQAASMNQLANLAQELAELAIGLQEAVSKFKHQ